MSVTSSLVADWNCLQVQVDRSISLAFAGVPQRIKAADRKAADRMVARIAAAIAAADFATRVKILFLKVQIRSLNDVPELDDVLLDRLPEIGGRTAAGRDREIAQFE